MAIRPSVVNTAQLVDKYINTAYDKVVSVADNIDSVVSIADVITDNPTLPDSMDIVAENVTDITNFNDVYQGAKNTDPTLRNDGSVLQSGDLYFNTSINALRAYSGSVWVSGTAGTMDIARFSGDGSDTTFTLPISPASKNNTQVYLNGVYQQKDTYSVSGTTLTFSEAPVIGTDNIEVVIISTTSIGETDASLVSYLPAGTIAATTVQGAINEIVSDLAANTGSSLVGYLPAGAGAVATNVQDKLREVVSVLDFGAVGDWDDATQTGTDSTAEIQAAIDYACVAGKRLVFPSGQYAISSPLIFPNYSFIIEGEGPTLTSIQATVASNITILFDMTLCNGPAKIIRDISFKGPQTGNPGNASAISGIGNGLNLGNVWFRGLKYGLNCGGSSFVNTINCTAEYCNYGVRATAAVVESVWTGWTFYRNDYDVYLSGACKSLVIQGTTSIACKYGTFLLSVASDVNINGLSVQDDSSGYTPTIIKMTGASQYNNISNVTIINFGLVGLQFDATANNNQISNVIMYGVPTGIYFNTAQFNNVSNLRITNSATYGILFETGATNYVSNFVIDTCAYGIYIFASNSIQLSNGVIRSSTTADFYYPVNNTILLFASNINANFTAITGIQYIGSYDGLGNKVVHSAAVPSGGSVGFAVGDRAHPRTPTVGQPKSWLCTVAGAPGTWVSEGNL